MNSRPYSKKPEANLSLVKKKNQYTFTHFISIPLIEPALKAKIQELQNSIYNDMTEQEKEIISLNYPDMFHITLSMLTIPRQEMQESASEALTKLLPQLQEIHPDGIEVDLSNLGFFKKPHKRNPGSDEYDELSLVYLDITPNHLKERLEQTCNVIMKDFISKEIIHEDDLKVMNIIYKNSKYKPLQMHITLFRVREQSYQNDSGQFVKYNWRKIFEKYGNYNIGHVKVPHLDISTRFIYDEDRYSKPLLRLKLVDDKEIEKESE